MLLVKKNDIYLRSDLLKLSEKELIQLLINETSHQTAMNIIRKKFQKYGS